MDRGGYSDNKRATLSNDKKANDANLKVHTTKTVNVMIAWLRNADFKEAVEDAFRLNGVPCEYLVLVGRVTKVVKETHKIKVTIDDGTGTLELPFNVQNQSDVPPQLKKIQLK